MSFIDSHLQKQSEEKVGHLQEEQQQEQIGRLSSGKRFLVSLILVPCGAIEKTARLSLHIIKLVGTPLTLVFAPEEIGRFNFDYMKDYADREIKAVLFSTLSVAASPIEMLSVAFSPLVLTVSPQIENKMSFQFAKLNRSLEGQISGEFKKDPEQAEALVPQDEERDAQNPEYVLVRQPQKPAHPVVNAVQEEFEMVNLENLHQPVAQVQVNENDLRPQAPQNVRGDPLLNQEIQEEVLEDVEEEMDNAGNQQEEQPKVWTKWNMFQAPGKFVANRVLCRLGKPTYKYKTGEEQE